MTATTTQTPVYLPSQLRTHTGGREVVPLPGNTVGELLDAMASQYVALGQKLLAKPREPHHWVKVYINDEDMSFLDGPRTTLKAGDQITLFVGIGGG